MDHDAAVAALWADWEERRGPGCECRPVLHTADGNPAHFWLSIGSQEKQGCPLHCTHYGISHSAAHWRCACGASA